MEKKTGQSFRRRVESPREFLARIIRSAAARGSMASWGQPFEAIASWLLMELDDQEPHSRGSGKPRDVI